MAKKEYFLPMLSFEPYTPCLNNSRVFQHAVKTLFCGILFILLLSADIHSQPPRQWVLKARLDANKGTFPQNSVNDIYFDNKTGFLWCTTEAGLVRYNGRSAHTFDSRQLKNLSSPRFFRIMQKSNNEVFAVSREAQAYKIYNDILVPYGNCFSVDTRQSFITQFNLADTLTDIVDDTDTGFLKDFSFENRQIFWVKKKEFLIGGDPGIFYISDKRVKEKYIDKGLRGFNFFQIGKTLYGVTINGKGYKISTNPFKVEKIRSDNIFNSGQALKFFFDNPVPIMVKGDSVFTITVKDDRISAALFAVLPEKIPLITDISINPNNSEIYCASYSNGLFIFRLSNFQTYFLPEAAKINFKPNFAVNNVYSIIPFDEYQKILTSDGIVFNLYTGDYILPPDQDERNFKANAGIKDANFEKPITLSLHDHVNYILDTRSYIWKIGVYDSFILKVEMKQNEQLYQQRKDLGDIFSFSRDDAGKIWAFSKKEFGLYTTEGFRHAGNMSWVPDSLKQYLPYKLSILTELPGNFLLGVLENNLFTLNLSTNQCRILGKIPSWRHISVRNKKYCWICTYGQGYFLFDLEERKLYKGPEDTKHYLLFPHCFVPDGKGRILIPTNKGLFRVVESQVYKLCKYPSPETLIYEYYDTKNGLRGNEFNGGCEPAYNVLPGGDVLFPSLDGVVRVYMSAFDKEPKYPVFIESIQTGKGVKSYALGMNFSATERTQKWIVNTAQWSDINAGNILYKLDNSPDWLPADPADNSISLSELTGGKHTLEIKVLHDLEGQLVSSEKIEFSIGKKYYEKTGFWILLVTALVAIMILTSQIRNYQIRKSNQKLAETVRQKTEELKTQNEKLEETITEVSNMIEIIKEKSEFQRKLIRLIGHDVMIPLKYIAKTARQLANYNDNISAELKSETIEEINTTSTGLTYLGQSIIQWIKMQETTFALSRAPIKVFAELQEIIPLHSKILSEKNNKLSVQIDPSLIFHYDATAMRIIIHNLVLNANKFTSDGQVEVSCFIKNAVMVMVVKDTGSGMSESIYNSLNKLIAVSPSFGPESDNGWGLGYNVITELIKISGGSLYIESAPGKGTTVTIWLPE